MSCNRAFPHFLQAACTQTLVPFPTGNTDLLDVAFHRPRHNPAAGHKL